MEEEILICSKLTAIKRMESTNLWQQYSLYEELVAAGIARRS
jgi:hypothetical protein